MHFRSSTVHLRAVAAAALVLGLTLVIAASAWAALAVSIDSGPDDPTSDRTPTFTFTPDPGATTVECSIDLGTPEPCQSPYTATDPLADGPHTFQVRVADDDEEQTAEYTFTVDATPPALSIDAGQEGPTNVAAPSFRFTFGGDATTVECSIDQGSPESCRSPYTVGAPLAEGTHTFHVQASDALGNLAGDELEFTVDTTTPTLSIGSGQAGPTNDATPSFAFTVAGATTVECSIDQGAPVSCPSSPYTVGAPLSDGRHTLLVQARDAAGNTSSDSLDFTIDTVRPAVSVTSGPTITSLGTPSFGFSAEAGAATECSIDSETPASCRSPYTRVAPLPDGRHTFRVRATDAAGNHDEATQVFTVDSAAPSLSIDSGPEGPTNATMPSFGFTAESGTSRQCAITTDPGVPTYGSCSGAATYAPAAPLPEGRYTFWVRARDSADNLAISSRDFTVDTTPPTLSITFGPTGTTGDSTPLFQFTAEAEATVACSIDQGTPAFGPCTGAAAHAAGAPLADGSYTFRVRATDRAGNQRIATRAFTVSTAPRPDPPPPVTTPPAPQLLSPFPLVRISGTLTTSGVRIRLLTVRAAPGTLVRVTVRPACARGRRASRRCRARQVSGTVGRRAVIGFRGLARSYRSGTVIVVRAWRADRIGKYTRFTIVRGKAPRRVDQCLMPGATRGSRCPSS